MFESARIRLTAWYLLLLMLISVLFSVAFYNVATNEIDSFIYRLEHEKERQNLGRRPRVPLEAITPTIEELHAVKKRVQFALIFINGAILVIAGGAGYFLAGRTLRPIKEMVDQRSKFISDASHELRTPLTSLRSEMEVSLLNKNLTLPEAKKLIASNLEEVTQLQALSENLLTLTHYEKTRAAVTFAKLSLAEVIDEALKKVNGQMKKKGIILKKQLKDTTVFGSKDRLRELITILLDNAVKYSGPKSTITITAAEKNKCAIITVSDQGIGIAKKELPYIFDRFYRSDESRSKQIKGFGLGLSIAKKIVTLHNGTIAVSSTLHKGTTFTVKLPRQKTS